MWAAASAEKGRAERGRHREAEASKSGVCNFFMFPFGAHGCFSVKADSFHSVAAVKRHCLRLVLSNIRDKLTWSQLHERSC